MRTLDGTGLAKRGAGGPSGGARRGPLAAALLSITLLCCLFGPPAPAGAVPQSSIAPSASAADFSAQALLARLALQQAVLTGANGGAGDHFGRSVAFSGDTVLVGAPVHDTAGMNQAGAAYVFVRDPGGLWVQEAELTAPDGAVYAAFGAAVALSGDTALVGAPVAKVAGQASMGAAYVFTRTAGIWTARQKLTPLDPAAIDNFGDAVALSGDTALVGMWFHPGAGGTPEVGAAYVFVRLADRPVWIQQAKLTAADGAEGDHFGGSVAISGDTVLIGASGHETAGMDVAGAAYVFTRSAGLWTQQAQLVADDGFAAAFFGDAVALAGDAALIGAPGYVNEGGAKAGVAYVFTRTAGLWTKQAKLSAADTAADDLFGHAVALSGERALVGAQWHGAAGKAKAGAAYVFTRGPGGAWAQQDELTAADAAAGDEFGTSIALSAETALVGAPYRDTDGQADTGVAYVFLLDPVPAVTLFAPTAGPVGTPVTITGSGLSGATAVAFNGAPATAFSLDSDTQVTAAVPSGATSGPIAVTTPGGTATSAAGFTVTAPAKPKIAKIKPASAKRGATVTITGSGFGAVRGKSSVTFGGKTCGAYVFWGSAQIRCKVPAKAAYGTLNVRVKTAGGTSNVVSFTVKR